MAIALAEAGADICLVMREPPPGTQPNMSTADAIRALGRRVEIVHCGIVTNCRDAGERSVRADSSR